MKKIILFLIIGIIIFSVVTISYSLDHTECKFHVTISLSGKTTAIRDVNYLCGGERYSVECIHDLGGRECSKKDPTGGKGFICWVESDTGYNSYAFTRDLDVWTKGGGLLWDVACNTTTLGSEIFHWVYDDTLGQEVKKSEGWLIEKESSISECRKGWPTSKYYGLLVSNKLIIVPLPPISEVKRIDTDAYAFYKDGGLSGCGELSCTDFNCVDKSTLFEPMMIIKPCESTWGEVVDPIGTDDTVHGLPDGSTCTQCKLFPRYALPDGSGCTQCFSNVDCGKAFIDFNAGGIYHEFECVNSYGDTFDDVNTFKNNFCKETTTVLDSSPNKCRDLALRWVTAGENNVGEYPDLITEQCCGDDPNEFYRLRECIGCDSSADDEACCNARTDCVYNGECFGSFTINNNLGATCIDGVWMTEKPELFYGELTYSELPRCGDLLCDILSNENCWSCPTDCSAQKEFGIQETELEYEINRILCGGSIACLDRYAPGVTCQALCDDSKKSVYGFGKRLEDEEQCMSDCQCISNNCVNTPENKKYCCPYGKFFDGQECAQMEQVEVGISYAQGPGVIQRTTESLINIGTAVILNLGGFL